MAYTKTNVSITLEDFLKKVSAVKSFTSTSGKRYQVIKYDGQLLKFLRLDGRKPAMEWNLNIKKLYQAYSELTDFSTENFRPYVPIQHSPARGLLLHLGLLKLQ